jgi:hypothetical protein
LWVCLDRNGQPARRPTALLATLYPTILFHPYSLMMMATWPLWLVQSIVRPLNIF